MYCMFFFNIFIYICIYLQVYMTENCDCAVILDHGYESHVTEKQCIFVASECLIHTKTQTRMDEWRIDERE